MKRRWKTERAFLLGVMSVAGSFAAPAMAQPASSARALPWMAQKIIADQQSAGSDAEREAIANRRATLLLGAMTLPQKMQQLTGSKPEILPELPHCFGARHVSGIADLAIPTFRITNGPVGLGQNDCISSKLAPDVAAGRVPFAAAYTHPTSAEATALPSALAAAAAFDPQAAKSFGEVIATEMHNLALHVFEAPGANLARLPILGRNFEYFGEDPYLTGVMTVAETRAVQDAGLIAMVKHYAANEQETNRMTVRAKVDWQTLRELYLLPFEMAVKDGKVASVMCAYNYVNGVSSCENGELMNDVLRRDWGFTGYVQSDFFAMKSTVPTMKGGMDHEMPLPSLWSPAKLNAALAAGELSQADIDQALVRRYTQMFKAGIFDRPLVQTPIDFAAGGAKARSVGTSGAVLLQNNGALPLSSSVRTVVMIGKASQPYAQQAVSGGTRTGEPMGSGGGSSDVVPHYSVSPIEGLRNALKEVGSNAAVVKLILVDDANEKATIDGAPASFGDALRAAGAADAVLMMAGTISEEGADRATFVDASGRTLASPPGAGSGLDWYAARNDVIAVATEEAAKTTAASLGGMARVTLARNSNSVAMLKAVMAANSTSGRSMAQKTVLVLKDNAGVAMDPALVGKQGPAILEVWFPGQEDGNIVADLLFGRKNPGGKLPVTFPYAGRGFLDSLTPAQFPGEVAAGGKVQTVTYTEKLHVGYRWYDANISGQCAPKNGRNPCVAFPFGHGLSYTSFALGKPRLAYDSTSRAWRASITVRNTGKLAGSEVVQAYISLPPSANAVGAVQPPKRLVGFQKVELAPGQSREVVITIDPQATHHPLGIWSSAEGVWVSPAGNYTLWLGRSSSPADIAQAGKIRIGQRSKPGDQQR
jgi:beta-glucosidase